MLRPLRLLNLLLGLVAALIAIVLVKTWVSPVAPPASGPAVTKASPEAEALAFNPTARPPLAQFDVLIEKNPFKQPPPMPARPFGGAPPPPLPTLVGTILVDSERRAILSDKGKANIYSVGQEVAGGVITDIKEDRIIFKRGDTTQAIALKAAIESAGTAPAIGLAPAAGPATAPAPPSGPSRPAAAGGAANREEMLRRRQEQVEQRRQLREQRKAVQPGARQP